MDAVVVGCEAIDAGPDWVRLRVPGAAVRSIPWGSITAAAAPTDDDHMTFEGKLAPITEFRATHVPLWIEYGDGVAVAMLERDDPRREAIVGSVPGAIGLAMDRPFDHSPGGHADIQADSVRRRCAEAQHPVADHRDRRAGAGVDRARRCGTFPSPVVIGTNMRPSRSAYLC
jgi:hypothetical protein